MKIVIRADASSIMGSGHVMRCLALGAGLNARGSDIVFATRDYPGALTELIKAKGYRAILMPDDNHELDPYQDGNLVNEIIAEEGGADWVIADRYGLNGEWDETVRRTAKKIMLIDDLVEEKRACDLLLNQNYLPRLEDRYRALLDNEPQLLLGPRYALLRPEFHEAGKGRSEYTGQVNNILISFGGSDSFDYIRKAVDAIQDLDVALSVDVVTGPSSQNIDAFEIPDGASAKIKYHESVNDMAALTIGSDLVIGALGVSTWERMCIGVPSVIVTIAANQEGPAQALSEDGYAVYPGKNEDVTAADISVAVRELMGNSERLKEFSRKGRKLVDGLGVSRVAEAIYQAS